MGQKENDRDLLPREIKDILKNYKTIAVVGLSLKEDRPSYQVAYYLQSKGFRVIPIRPLGKDILGEKVYPSLLEVPFEIDIVDIFRKPEAVLEIVKEAIEKRAKVVWMQEGVINKEAAELARKAGIKVVMDRCIKKDHQNLFG
ncbi:MAG: CoA-binding protein [Thermodesulfobacteriota bacterium]